MLMLLALVAGLAQTPSPTAQVSGRVVEQGSGATRRSPRHPLAPLAGTADDAVEWAGASHSHHRRRWPLRVHRCGSRPICNQRRPRRFRRGHDWATARVVRPRRRVSKDDIVVTFATRRCHRRACRRRDWRADSGLRVVPFRPSPAPPGGTTSAQPPRMLPRRVARKPTTSASFESPVCPR